MQKDFGSLWPGVYDWLTSNLYIVFSFISSLSNHISFDLSYYLSWIYFRSKKFWFSVGLFACKPSFKQWYVWNLPLGIVCILLLSDECAWHLGRYIKGFLVFKWQLIYSMGTWHLSEIKKVLSELNIAPLISPHGLKHQDNSTGTFVSAREKNVGKI